MDVNMLPSEKEVLIELLKIYKDSPCLWDQRHLLYTNKEARKKAYELLLEKYKRFNEEATIDMVKRKLENMRTTYRREKKKVLAARANCTEEYCPILWYFDLISFVDKDDYSSWLLDQNINRTDVEHVNREVRFEDSEEIYLDEEPQEKRRKNSPTDFGDGVSTQEQTTPDISRVFLPSHNNESLISVNNEDISPEIDVHSEAMAFGHSLGLQLEELDGLQRIVAQKLISDTIFYARLNKLTAKSSIQLN